MRDITGIHFIKLIFNHIKSEIAVPYLPYFKLNMLEVYWNDTEIFYGYNHINNYSDLTVKTNKKYYNLFNSFARVEREQYMRQLKDIEPFIVIRTKRGSTEDRYEKCKENLGKYDELVKDILGYISIFNKKKGIPILPEIK